MNQYGDKELIYDEKISPLMTSIIEICRTNGINMVASYQLRSREETDDAGDHLCTTLLPMHKEHYPEEYKAFSRLIYQRGLALAVTITKQ